MKFSKFVTLCTHIRPFLFFRLDGNEDLPSFSLQAPATESESYDLVTDNSEIPELALPALVIETDPMLPQNDPGIDELKGRAIVDLRHFMIHCRMLERHR